MSRAGKNRDGKGRSVGIFSFMRFYGRTDWALTLIILVMTFAQVYLELELPQYMAEITDVITAHGTTDEVVSKSFAMAACAVGSLAVGLMISVQVGWISSSVAKRIRATQFNHIQKFSMAEVDRISAASLITRSTNDVKQIQDFIGIALQSLMKSPIISVWAILRISSGNLTWTAATFTAVLLMTVTVVTIMRLTAPRYKLIQRLKDAINGQTSATVTGQRVIRAYNAEEYEEERFTGINSDLMGTIIGVNHIMAANVPINSFLRNTLTMVIYWLGAFIIAGTSSEPERLVLFSDMIVFATYATMALNAFRSIVQIFNVFPRAKVSMNRIWEVLTTEPTILDGEKEEGECAGSLSFDRVSFRYPGAAADTIHDVSFTINPGETVALIGATGCGKSTLAHLISRFYDCSEGSVEVDGIDVRDYRKDSLRSRVGYVTQKSMLLKGNFRDNVNYGEGSESRTDDDIWNALRVACIDDFVEKSGGLDAPVAEEGKNLSGGQKQRISIARAVCKGPEIYVFDDCFSALDYRTDREIRTRLGRATDLATVLLITQRVGTARSADRILVMDEGTIIAQGTHSELLDSCIQYREIAVSQHAGGDL
ncbi:MAG: ABC transporter ATP-binding protein [Candidatus Methanomethylophilaceae archaeon]|nr:ABC transporter ATP-binding protein [Candidatus Methanomethylophilaceae archaeon]